MSSNWSSNFLFITQAFNQSIQYFERVVALYSLSVTWEQAYIHSLKNWSGQRTEKEFGSWFILVELEIFTIELLIFTRLVRDRRGVYITCFITSKVVKIRILRKIAEGKKDCRLQDRFVDRKIGSQIVRSYLFLYLKQKTH